MADITLTLEVEGTPVTMTISPDPDVEEGLLIVSRDGRRTMTTKCWLHDRWTRDNFAFNLEVLEKALRLMVQGFYDPEQEAARRRTFLEAQATLRAHCRRERFSRLLPALWRRRHGT